MENDLQNKVELIHFKLGDMRGRLVHTAAEMEHAITIERITYRALQLRLGIREKEAEVKELEEQLGVQSGACEEIERILDAIAREMAKAMETDELEMWSELVHDQPQVVEVEELKVRLAARSEREQEMLAQERQRLKALDIKVSRIYRYCRL